MKRGTLSERIEENNVVLGFESTSEISNELFIHHWNEIVEFDGNICWLFEVHKEAVGFRNRYEVLLDEADCSERFKQTVWHSSEIMSFFIVAYAECAQNRSWSKQRCFHIHLEWDLCNIYVNKIN